MMMMMLLRCWLIDKDNLQHITHREILVFSLLWFVTNLDSALYGDRFGFIIIIERSHLPPLLCMLILFVAWLLMRRWFGVYDVRSPCDSVAKRSNGNNNISLSIPYSHRGGLIT